MALGIPAIFQKISVVSLLSILTLGAGSHRPVHAFALSLEGSSAGSWTLPTNATSSTQLSGQKGGTNNVLEWGLTRSQVSTCVACTDFNNVLRFDGTDFNPQLGGLFSVGQLTYRNASTTDIVNGQFQTVDFALPLKVALLFGPPGQPGLQFNFDFGMRNTPNIPGDPIASADILSFSATGATRQRFELGGKHYQLQLLGFGTTTGSLSGAFNVPEAMTSMEFFTASLFAQIDEDDQGGVCH